MSMSVLCLGSSGLDPGLQMYPNSTSAEQRERITSLQLLLLFFLMQPRMSIAVFAVQVSLQLFVQHPSLWSCFPAQWLQHGLMSGFVHPQGQNFPLLNFSIVEGHQVG